MDERFETVWNALVENGTSKRNHDATERFWRTLMPKQQEMAYRIIPRKVRDGKFVQYDPIRAIKENIRSHQLPQPEFLRGDEEGELVQVLYNGLYKICTPETAKAYGLQIIRTWK